MDRLCSFIWRLHRYQRSFCALSSSSLFFPVSLSLFAALGLFHARFSPPRYEPSDSEDHILDQKPRSDLNEPRTHKKHQKRGFLFNCSSVFVALARQLSVLAQQPLLLIFRCFSSSNMKLLRCLLSSQRLNSDHFSSAAEFLLLLVF